MSNDTGSTEYHHTQIGYGLLGCAAAVAGLLVFIVMGHGTRSQPPILTALILLPGFVACLALVAFSSLTISIRDGALTWKFGPGLARQTIPLRDITSAETTRTSPMSGWGIRRTADGWLYNVGGLSAVVVRTAGRTVLLGSDEPNALATAILGGNAATMR